MAPDLLTREKLASVVVASERLESSGPEAPQDRESTFEVEERWEGVVEEVVGDRYFFATIINLGNDQSATVKLERRYVASADRRLIEPGALFFWHIGRRVGSSGDVERVSSIVFRRQGSRPNIQVDPSLRDFWLDATRAG